MNTLYSMSAKRKRAATLVAALLFWAGAALPAAAAAENESPWSHWRAKRHADSPVIGIHAAGPNGPATKTPEQLVDELAAADYVLLGETHDNPDHHALQAWIIDRMASRGRKPRTVFEMIDAGQEEALRNYLLKDGANAAGLGAALDWENHGWPAWSLYQPVAEATLAAARKSAGASGPAENLPILSAGGPARDAVMAVTRGGFDAALSKADQERMGLGKALPEALAADLREELFEDHCKLMPKEAMGPLLNIQRLRDATFADRLLAARGPIAPSRRGNEERRGEGATVVLIAGGGHVRKDRGVPYYLSARDPAAKLAVVIFSEANDEMKSAADIRFISPGSPRGADFVWVTPAADREDQCEKLRQRMEKKKEPPGAGR